jgi:hypothetical protein
MSTQASFELRTNTPMLVGPTNGKRSTDHLPCSAEWQHSQAEISPLSMRIVRRFSIVYVPNELAGRGEFDIARCRTTTRDIPVGKVHPRTRD